MTRAVLNLPGTDIKARQALDVIHDRCSLKEHLLILTYSK
jgi:hypothetical protein